MPGESIFSRQGTHYYRGCQCYTKDGVSAAGEGGELGEHRVSAFGREDDDATDTYLIP